MIRTNDGNTTKRVGGKPGDRTPVTGFQRQRALYKASGGETSITTSSLSPQITYIPGAAQISVKRSSGGTMISGLDFFESTATSIGFPVSDPLIAGEVVEIIKEFSITGVMAMQPRPDMYTNVGVVGQTLVTCGFSWPYNMNPTFSQGAVEVFLHGALQARGIDYTEVNLGTSNTNQITFVDPLVGGENIVIRPVYQVLDQTAATSTFQGNQISSLASTISAGAQGFVDQSILISVPSTTVVNRSQMVDPSQDLKARMGIERVPAQGLYLIQGEFGPNGEPVYGMTSDTQNAVRLVGSWIQAGSTFGQYLQGQSLNDFTEITFYGTGLNLLTDLENAAPASLDVRATVDGGVEGGNIIATATYQGILGQRGYSVNQVVPVVSGLTLGIHTIKLRRNNGAGTNYLNFYGFEILNISSTNVVVNQGSAYIAGQKYASLVQTSFAASTGVTGTRGGRTLVYLKADGTIGQAFQAVNGAQANLTSADHTNEEIARSYSFREFGAGSTVDFSGNLAGSTAVFTMDDGTTNLKTNGSTVASAVTGMAENMFLTNGSFLTLTFVGTGLDIVNSRGVSATASTYSVIIDGNTVATGLTGASFSGSSLNNVIKIVSGLPYGTHTFKLLCTNQISPPVSISRFIVYQPKKPALPVGAVELADYNVMANYALNANPNTTGSVNVSSGVLRKMNTREFTYAGSTWTLSGFDTGEASGFNFYSTTAGDYVECNFLGTGADVGFASIASGCNATVTVDGSSNLTGIASLTGISGVTFTPSTGALSCNSAANTYGNVLSITGLAYGMHKVRFTKTGGGNMYIDCVDVITPIHSAKTSQYNQQNTLPVGSCSISDNRKTTMVKDVLPASKAWSQALGISGSPSTSSTTPVPMPDMSCTIKTQTSGSLRISLNCELSQSTGGNLTTIVFYVDGIQVAPSFETVLTNANQRTVTPLVARVPVGAGTHKVDAYWYSNSGTVITAINAARVLLVEEV